LKKRGKHAQLNYQISRTHKFSQQDLKQQIELKERVENAGLPPRKHFLNITSLTGKNSRLHSGALRWSSSKLNHPNKAWAFGH